MPLTLGSPGISCVLQCNVFFFINTMIVMMIVIVEQKCLISLTQENTACPGLGRSELSPFAAITRNPIWFL